MKMFLTRLGFNSKMVVTGDITQIDLPRDQQSGLIVVGDILEEVEGIEFVRFGGEDVVRHRLVQRIVEAYDEHAERAAPSCARAARPPTAGGRSGRARGRGHRPRRRRVGRADRRPRSSALVRARARVGGRRGRPRRGRVRRRRADRGAQRASTAARSGPTDVLSFPIDEARRRPPGPRELGDIVICPEHTEDLREAVVHGALHLTGMDHETDDGEMLALQAELLRW